MVGQIKSQWVILLLVLLAMPMTASSRILNVPGDYGTIQDAVDHSQAGDTILVAPGDYEHFEVHRRSNLTFIGAGLEADQRSVVWGVISDTIVGVLFDNCEGIVFKGFEVRRGYTGVWVHQSRKVYIGYNYIHDTQTWWASSISADGDRDLIIEHNIMTRSWHYGLYLVWGSTNTVVRNNVIASTFNNDGIHLDRASNANIYNNIIYRCSDWGIYFLNQCDNIRIEYNCIYGNRDVCNVQLSETNIFDDPLFLDGRNDDFHLSEESPCIDAGDPNSDPDGDGTRADIGIFYFPNPAEFEVTPQELDLGQVAQNDQSSARFRVIYTNGELNPILLRLELPNQEPWLSINWSEVEMQIGDTLDVLVTASPDIHTAPGQRVTSVNLLRENDEDPFFRLPVFVDILARQRIIIPLNRGWNLISSPTPPPVPEMPSVWSGVVGRHNLQISKDEGGRFYLPATGFCNMSPWSVPKGYFAKLAGTDTLEIDNIAVDPTTPISLRPGWNLISYFPAEGHTAPVAFLGLGNHLAVAKDGAGRFYQPRTGYSNMGQLTRGKGYQVKVDQAMDFVWGTGQRMMNDDDDGIGGRKFVESTPVHFAVPEPTGRNMSLLLTPPPAPPASGGEWEIGLFTKTGLCVGAVPIQIPNSKTQNLVGLAVWGDDPTTDEIDGAVEGEELFARVWDGRAEYPVRVGQPSRLTDDRQAGRLSYATDGFAEVDIGIGAQGLAPLPNAFSVSSAHPDPFNSTTTINYSLPEAADVEAAVFDVAGREVATLDQGYCEAGEYNLSWNADRVQAGIYFVRISAGSSQSVRKVVLVR